MAKPRAVVFDLGRVLVDYDYTRLFGYFADHGLVVDNEADLLAQSRLVDYECGRIDDAAFFSHLSGLMPSRPDGTTLHARWLNIFTPAKRMLAFARELKTRAPVYILSNVSAAHFVHLRNTYELARLAEDVLTSFEAGCMKPDPAIYQAAEARFGLDPAAILFVDDVLENVAAARRCGWSAIHHTDPNRTVVQVNDWLGSSGLQATDDCAPIQ